MKWVAELSEWRRFVIEHDVAVGFYLYVFEGADCTRDHLQDTLEAAIAQAYDDYGVDRAAWRETSN